MLPDDRQRGRRGREETPSARHPFASPSWLDALGAELAAVLSDLDPDVSFSFGERYLARGEPDCGWHVRHEHGRSMFLKRPAEDVDVELVVDLEVARRSCRPMTPELAQLLREASRDGRVTWRGDPQGLPAALRTLHERMIELTAEP